MNAKRSAKKPATSKKTTSKAAAPAKAQQPAAKSVKRPKKTSAPAKRKSAPAVETETFYFFVEAAAPRIAKTPPKTNGQVAKAESFVAAKEKAVDHLIEIIESFERRLWALKQATDFAAYCALVDMID